MKYEIINEKDAPTAPKAQSQSAAEAADIVSRLKKGKVARIEPEHPQTIRSLRVNLGRSAKAAGISLQTWDVDGILYVKAV